LPLSDKSDRSEICDLRVVEEPRQVQRGVWAVDAGFEGGGEDAGLKARRYKGPAGKEKRDFSLRRPTASQEAKREDKASACSVRNDNGGWGEEVEMAFGKEIKFETERKQRRTVLFPIRLDDAVMKTEEAWAADIRRTRHIGDFREWKDHDEYQKAFGRLMRDLKAGDKGSDQ
jgi:hypothetical protein